MDGVHDLGGLVGFGSVEHEPMEPVFHEPWEGRVFGMMGAVSLAGYTSGPSFRHAIERMDGVHYLASSYYEHWLTGLATLLVERGVISASDLLDRVDDFPLARPIADDPLPPAFAHDPSPSAAFPLGARVRVRNVHPRGHTRCPDYVRDREGVVVRVDPPANVPELEAHAGRVVPETVYCVRFACADLWGDGRDGATVHVDLYERYLEAV